MQEEFVRWKPHAFNSEKRLSKSDCTNRMSLRKPFYAMEYSLYRRTEGSYQKVREGHGRKGNIGKRMEVSRKREISPSISKQTVDKAVRSHGQRRNEKDEIGRRS